MSELKPCPFCGGEVELITRGNEHTKKRSAEIYCKNCVLTMVVGAVRNPMSWCIKTVSEKWQSRPTEGLDAVYEALGWQGGTIHQIVDEIKRLRHAAQKGKL